MLSKILCTSQALSAEVVDFEWLIQDYSTCQDIGEIMFHNSGSTHLSGRFHHCRWILIQGQPIMHSKHFFAGIIWFGKCMREVSLDTFGQDKNITCVEDWFYWLNVKRIVSKVVSHCQVCQFAQDRTQDYTLLSIPSAPRDHLSMDFILGLLCTHRKHDYILVVVDKFSKTGHFIPCSKTADASHMAHLFFGEIMCLHGLSKSIVSDKDVCFTSHFWRTLWKKMGTALKFSTAYHPQIDGQTEVVNHSLGDLLRCF